MFLLFLALGWGHSLVDALPTHFFTETVKKNSEEWSPNETRWYHALSHQY